MAQEFFPGQKITVTVAGSSANLDPGFDALGSAIALYDIIEAEVIKSGVVVEIRGEDEVDLPRSESNLVVRAIRVGLHAADIEAPGLKVICHNTIPQSRGLGSSATAAVTGVAAANGLTGFPLTDDQIIQESSVFEGHPDNAGTSVLGGAMISWTGKPVDGRTAPQYRAASIPMHESIQATALVPAFHASTSTARQVLPSDASRIGACFNVSHTAVMTTALQSHPELLWEGTRDRLHQPCRSDVPPMTAEWVNRLHNRDYAAFLSGAGSTCMVLGTTAVDEKILDDTYETDIEVMELGVGKPIKVVVDD